jgi:hypothetical protein
MTRASLLFLLAIGLAAGFHFGNQTYDVGPNHLGTIINRPSLYTVYGKVADWPDLRADRTEIKLSVDSLAGPVTRVVTIPLPLSREGTG